MTRKFIVKSRARQRVEEQHKELRSWELSRKKQGELTRGILRICTCLSFYYKSPWILLLGLGARNIPS